MQSKQGLVLVLGDINLDLNRFEEPTYYLKTISDQYQIDLGEGGFEIINFGDTWKDRAIDHTFCNKPEVVIRHGK